MSQPYVNTNDIFPAPPVDRDQCFLCRVALKDLNRSKEHVIPLWLQERFSLLNEELTLLNGTSIPYRQATIPCCSLCNSGPLSKLEKEVQQAFQGGIEAIRALPEERLFQWCSKIFFGLFVRENNLLADRKDPSIGPIADKALLERLKTLHFFMQSIRKPFVFDGFRPFSILVMETLTSPKAANNFDFFDSLAAPRPDGVRLSLALAIRVGDVGVICAFQDNGVLKDYLQVEIDKFRGIPLHPFQFIEFATLSICKCLLLSYVPLYAIYTTPNDEILVDWQRPSNQHVWEDWDTDLFAARYSGFLTRAGCPMRKDEVYKAGGYASFLFAGSQPIRFDWDLNRIEGADAG
jgi:hypothetical protein